MFLCMAAVSCRMSNLYQHFSTLYVCFLFCFSRVRKGLKVMLDLLEIEELLD